MACAPKLAANGNTPRPRVTRSFFRELDAHSALCERHFDGELEVIHLSHCSHVTRENYLRVHGEQLKVLSPIVRMRNVEPCELLMRDGEYTVPGVASDFAEHTLPRVRRYGFFGVKRL